jgi:acyl-CoA reductase-like NAD-dependent aldehyde dehydrogenase
MVEAGVQAGMPPGLIGCLTHVSLPGTQELMRHKYVALILATGGSDMVRAAHSVGKPAYGVGPGNVPVYVDRSADLRQAARYIVASKAFDHSVICATEQAVVADQPIAAQLAELMQAEGATSSTMSRKTPSGGCSSAPATSSTPRPSAKAPSSWRRCVALACPPPPASWWRVSTASAATSPSPVKS